MNAVILFAPTNDLLKAELAAYLNPTMTLLAFVAWRLWERLFDGD